jgi:hypothetical protein
MSDGTANGAAGLTITKCEITLERVYPEHEKAPGFSPPTSEPDPRGEAHALPAGHQSDNIA